MVKGSEVQGVKVLCQLEKLGKERYNQKKEEMKTCVIC